MNLRQGLLAILTGYAALSVRSRSEHMQQPSDSPAAFSSWLGRQGKQLELLSPSELVAAALGFYSSVRCLATGSEPGSDMLLFQWGVYDWGKGANFEFDLTRQFSTGHRGDADLSQFRLTAYFQPTPALAGIPPGNRWCEDVQGLAEFRSFILASKALAAVTAARATTVVASWSAV